MDNIHQILIDKFPFLTLLTYGNNEYVGIIQNVDDFVTTIYDFSAIRDTEHKTLFLELGDQWWWESNRLLPINIFFKQDWAQFRPCLKTMNSKDVAVQCGPLVSLRDLASKRSKRRSITLIRRLD